MAGVNTKVVHRSNALLNYAYGRDFRYDEAMLVGAGPRGRIGAYAIAGALGGFVTMAAIAPARWALTRFLVPAPGEGPSPEAQRKGFYDLRFLGLLGDGRPLARKLPAMPIRVMGPPARCLERQPTVWRERTARQAGFGLRQPSSATLSLTHCKLRLASHSR
jgi:hypothetical protein